MNRLEAFRAVRSGDVVTVKVVGKESPYGRPHTYTLNLYSDNVVIQDYMMGHRDRVSGKMQPAVYIIRNLTPKQILSFIRRHFPIRNYVRIEKDPFREVA